MNFFKRKEERQATAEKLIANPVAIKAGRSKRPLGLPIGALTAVLFVGVLGSLWMGQNYDVDQCKVRVAEENRVKFEALKQQRLAEAKAKQLSSSQGQDSAVDSKQSSGQYQNIFAPSNLGQQIESDSGAEPQSETETKDAKQYQNIFAPTNLGQQVESSSDSD